MSTITVSQDNLQSLPEYYVLQELRILTRNKKLIDGNCIFDYGEKVKTLNVRIQFCLFAAMDEGDTRYWSLVLSITYRVGN